MRHHRHEGDEGRCREPHNGDHADRIATPRLGPRRPGAEAKRGEQPDLKVASGRWGQANEEEGHYDREERHGVGDEGDRVAEGGDRHACERWADDAPEIELCRVEGNCGEELRRRHQVREDGLLKRPGQGADRPLDRDEQGQDHRAVPPGGDKDGDGEGDGPGEKVAGDKGRAPGYSVGQRASDRR